MNSISPDLVVTDMTMPGMTGDRLAMEMMKNRLEIPVTPCTSCNSKRSAGSAAEIGRKAFSFKPVIKERLG
jgi:DNA-binding NtrC family response regulator